MGFHFSITKKLNLRSIIVLAVLILGFAKVNAQDVAAGESIFKANCTACHAIDRQVIGPALKDVESRWADKATLKKFILNSQSVIKGGDKYASDLYQKFNQTVMPNQNLSDAELENLLAYIKEAPNKKAAATADAGAGAAATTTDGSSINNYTIGGIILLIVVLIIVIFVLNRVIGSLERLVRVKNGEILDAVVKAVKEKVSTFKWILLNKKKVFFGAALFFIVFSVWGWNQMASIGIQQGYQPAQPIKFSHELHAGVNQINCQYCH